MIYTWLHEIKRHHTHNEQLIVIRKEQLAVWSTSPKMAHLKSCCLNSKDNWYSNGWKGRWRERDREIDGSAVFHRRFRRRTKNKCPIRYCKAMSWQCWKANSQWLVYCGHFRPCLWAYQSAMRAVTQCIKARVISRTDNWTLILADIVEGMICQPDRASVLTSADWLHSEALCIRIRPQAWRQQGQRECSH